MENNNFNNNPMKPEENIEKVETKPEVSTPTQENVTEPKVEVNINQPKVEVNIGQPEVKVTIEQSKAQQAKPEGKMQKFKSTFKDKMSKFKNFAIKRKPLVIAASVLLVAGITTGIVVGAVAASGGFVTPVKDKFDKMKDYYRDYLIRSVNIDNYKDISAKKLLKRGAYWKTVEIEGVETKVYSKLIKVKLGSDFGYYMEDIDYNYGSDRDSWPASSHVSQAKAIAITAYVKHDPEMMNIAVGMTNYWVYNNFRNTNWWHNDLGAGANDLANVGIFVFDHLSSLGKSLLCSKVAHASFYYRPSILTHAGTNLFDYADITLRSSIFTKNEDEFKVVVKRVQDEITDRHLEGFQTDGSFFQHGQQVQIASYGKGVIRLAKVLKAISMSGEHFATEKMHIIERYLLKGLRNMTHRGYLNYSAVSREYTRLNNLSAEANNFSQFSEYLDIPDFTEHDELKAYLDSITNKTPSVKDGELTYFNRARMITLNSDGLYMSFKGTADYLTNTECVNFENRLGLNLSYGTNTCVMDKGDEYYNIAPLWNYAYIPGTTSIQLVNGTEEENTEFSNPGGLPRESGDKIHYTVDDRIVDNIVNQKYKDDLYEDQLPSGKSDGSILYEGAMYPDNINDVGNTEVAVLMQRSVHHEENEFTVTCIACKQGMILLGSNITYLGTKTGDVFTGGKDSRKLHTTLEQCKYNRDYTLDPTKKALTIGNALYKIVDIEGTPSTDTIQVERSGELHILHGWKRNNKNIDDAKEKTTRGETLTAFIQHAGNSNVSYAYSIQPKSLNSKPFKLYNNDGIIEVALPDDNKTTVIVSYMETPAENPYEDHKTGKEWILNPGDIKFC